jgi:protein-tyrosine phosphatase
VRAALAIACLLGGCAVWQPVPPAPATYDGFGLTRFYRVDENLYSGAQPNARQMAELVERYHIRTVIKLSPRWQGRTVVPKGVILIERPIPAVFTPTAAQMDQILDDLERSPKPVFVHCRLGADRTGLVVALYQLRHGASVREAESIMRAHGFRPYTGITRIWTQRVASMH